MVTRTQGHNYTRILTYHSVGENGVHEVGSELYCVSENRFMAQVEYMVKRLRSQAHKVARSHVKDFFCDFVSLRLCDVILTFDDGLLNNYTNAYPILKEFGLKGYFFILVGKVGTAGYMSWQQIRELKDAGMTIGSHGMTHRILVGLNYKDINYEFNDSKKIIENKLGCAIDCLSIPRGFNNKKILDKAREAGYKTIFTSSNRIAVKADWDLEKFTSVLHNGFSLAHKGSDLVKSVSKRVLGARRYDALRTKILVGI